MIPPPGPERDRLIALKLGWEREISPLYGNRPRVRAPRHRSDWIWEDELPRWSTNDALAFVEIWPKVLEWRKTLVLGLTGDSYGVLEPCQGESGSDSNGVWIKFTYKKFGVGLAWADAITRAFLEAK